ncbi:MAG: PEP-CTERM sorting domain-containing protein [Verrucomicrobiaceae bacterium]|nr:PEP-CTERM sorting domain-containing protein [Verrucomicrobiaceae bacterium]
MPRLLLISLGSLMLTVSAPAAVIYSGLQNISIPNDFEGVYLNTLTGATSTILPGNWNNAPMINPFFGGTAIGTSALLRPVITGADQIENLAYSTIVGPGSSFAAGESGSSTHIGAAANQFQLGVEGWLGYAFESTPGGSTMYGVMRLTLNNSGYGATIHDWYYDDSGAPVSVPEPGRSGLLLVFLGCLVLRRRRR